MLHQSSIPFSRSRKKHLCCTVFRTTLSSYPTTSLGTLSKRLPMLVRSTSKILCQICMLILFFVQIVDGFLLSTFATAWVLLTFSLGTSWTRLILHMPKCSMTLRDDSVRKLSLGKVLSIASMLTQTWY